MEPLRQKKRHAERQEYIRSKKNVPCMDCGNVFPDYCMDFHHIEEDTKNPIIGRNSFIDRMKKCSIKTIDEEISKCVIICACCHRIRHHSNNEH